jgi:hypothetical protein
MTLSKKRFVKDGELLNVSQSKWTASSCAVAPLASLVDGYSGLRVSR